MEGLIAENLQPAENTVDSGLVDAALALETLDEETEETLSLLIEPVIAEEVANSNELLGSFPATNTLTGSGQLSRVEEPATDEDTATLFGRFAKNALSQVRLYAH